jgi:LmbE family N-acetylglucosaminyl deacetylase/uncharacterized membrane protein YbhN (UPF0104 family)
MRLPHALHSLSPELRRAMIGGLYAVLILACAATIGRAIAHDGGLRVVRALAMLRPQDLALSAILVVGIYAVMSVMERLALRDAHYADISLRAWPVPLLANSVSTGTGFGALSGGAIRMRLYARWGVDPATSVFVASSVTLMSIAGGAFVAALGFVFSPDDIARALGVGPDLLRLAGAVMLGGFAITTWIAGPRARLFRIAGQFFRIPRATGWVTRVAAGAIDWLISAGALFVLLPHDPGRHFAAFAGTFAAVHLTSMLTGAPAGIGVFDAIMLTLNPTAVPTESLAAALIAYRLLSFVTPTALGALGLALFEASGGARRHEPARPAAVAESGNFARRHATTRFVHALSQAWARAIAGQPPHQAVSPAHGRGAAHQRVADLFRAAERQRPLSLQALTGGGPIVIVAPHADDETLGCGGLLAGCAAMGVKAHVVVLTDGARSHLGSLEWPTQRLVARRAVEVRRALARLGLGRASVSFFDNPDGALLFRPDLRERAAERLVHLANRLRAKRIFVTWRHDPHPDHVAASLVAERAVARHKRIKLVQFPIWGLFLPGEAKLADRGWRARRLDVRAHLVAKRRAIAAYRTQTTHLISDAPVAHRLSVGEWKAFLGPFETYFF